VTVKHSLALCITRGTQKAQRCVDAPHTHQLHRYRTHRQTRARTHTHTYAQVVIISEREDRGTARQLEKTLQEALRINCLCVTSSLRSEKEWGGTGEKSVRTRGSRSSPHKHAHAYIDNRTPLAPVLPCISQNTHVNTQHGYFLF
jgi:hypothetical protein